MRQALSGYINISLKMEVLLQLTKKLWDSFMNKFLEKLSMNAKIMKTQIFHKMNNDLKGSLKSFICQKSFC